MIKKKRTTDFQFRRLVSKYRDGVNLAIHYGFDIPPYPKAEEGRSLTAFQQGYLSALRDEAWRRMQAEWIWCIFDPATGGWAGCWDGLSEAGKELHRSASTSEDKSYDKLSKFVWARTFKDVIF